MIKKISDKDKKDWENFLNKNEDLPNKDESNFQKKTSREKVIDLHGKTLEEANRYIYDLIQDSYDKNIQKLIIITGKGIHSNNKKDPYKSIEYGILKHSVPDFIKKEGDLMKLINKIEDANIEDGGSGAFYVYLKKKI